MQSDARLAERLHRVLAVHFDPRTGTPYWLERAAKLDFDPIRDIRNIDDLGKFGLMDALALRERPLSDFLPRSLGVAGDPLILAQTGGTLGAPIWTAYSAADFDAAFVAPFVAAAEYVSFPAHGTWLYVGPSGPHIIGRAAVAIARARGMTEPFTVDFDSRWAKKLPPSSFAAQRYLTHVADQAMEVIASQPITHLFTTPPVLAELAPRMNPAQRARIAGVHYGGMSIAQSQMLQFQTQLFPNAMHLSGYGNTLFGCCLELNVSAGRALDYFPHGGRLLFSVQTNQSAGMPALQRTPGARGRCVFSRLDESMLLINFAENDEIELVPRPSQAPPSFDPVGIRDPHRMHASADRVLVGIY